jgi:hypothetical protein
MHSTIVDQPEPIICEDVLPESLRALASAVITQVIRDILTKKQAEKRLGAFVWLTGPELEAWSDFADATINPYKILPNLREVKKQLYRRASK